MTAAFKLRLPHLVVPATNWQKNVGPVKKRHLVIHVMQAPEKDGTAMAVANYFARQKTTDKVRTSAHYCVDSRTIVQCVAPERIAWHAPGCNSTGIGLELSGYVSQTKTQWLDEFGKKMLALAAPLAAELCQHFQIPVEFVDEEGLIAGHAGITTHAKVSLAFKKSTHTDPGPGFPMTEFLDMIRVHTDAGRA